MVDEEKVKPSGDFYWFSFLAVKTCVSYPESFSYKTSVRKNQRGPSCCMVSWNMAIKMEAAALAGSSVGCLCILFTMLPFVGRGAVSKWVSVQVSQLMTNL